ncbi:sensor histidine kinase [Halomonas sp. E14]|uniref:sensor histidine kinase n=1 Tax=Halomonas sp. E14 TaxID=3397245 RepID=UPI00403E5D9F
MNRLSAVALHRLASLFAFMLLIVLALQAGRAQQALLVTHEAVDEGLALITAIQDLQVSLLEVETGERGFVITGRSDYLVPYQSARQRLDAERSLLLERLEAKQRLSNDRLSQLAALIERRVSIAENNIAVRGSDGLEAAALRLLAAGGRQTMAQIHGILDPLKRDERERLAVQSARAAEQAARARTVGIIGIVFVVILFLAAFGALNRVLTIRRLLLERAEHREARLHALLHAMPDDLYVIDHDRRVLRLVGDMPVSEAFVRELHEHLESSGTEELLHSFVWHDPYDAEFEVRMLPTWDDEHLVIARNITQRREMERMKAEFIATVSHELRTPLTAVKGALSMLQQGYAGELTDDARLLVQVADKNGQRLVRLIDDILDIEKLEAGQLKVHLQQVDLLALVEQALVDNAPYAESFGVKLQHEFVVTQAELELDPHRFSQVLANLISNACKHSPAGATVTIIVRLVKHAGADWWEVAVSDSGDGIPLEFQPRVFERFAQADSSDRRRSGGTGLGLAITRGLVHAMGGEIGFTSVPKAGTEFQVRFPALPKDGRYTKQAKEST